MRHQLVLHHCAKRIVPHTLEFVMELFQELGCQESYWKDGARWAMIKQGARGMIVQFIETDQKPQTTDEKRNSHIAFLSDDPLADIAALKMWIEGRGKQCMQGSWSDWEHYLDCPEVFIDFVVEVMHRSIVEE